MRLKDLAEIIAKLKDLRNTPGGFNSREALEFELIRKKIPAGIMVPLLEKCDKECSVVGPTSGALGFSAIEPLDEMIQKLEKEIGRENKRWKKNGC